MIRDLPSLAATRAFGAEIAQLVEPGTVIAINGELGAGKTEFVRGFVAALAGAKDDEVASPTYALVHRYETDPAVWHADLYRLENERELIAVGAEEFLDPVDEITLVEWAERFPDYLPKRTWHLRLETLSQSARRATLTRP
ncbi:MAG: tRNA (adenosine(37)-N6)-threonylcarbamoyltransferase complex ATPase subunit type 1 TsaE [Myxococcota bacterium]|nr:tRNA (adenosine(37)-N6)-threonylcarbamoyltransferase complex ATPase subunit type 1 TsaE [Myxococcota bacterium]